MSFLNVYALLSAPPPQMAEPIPFLPPFFPPPEIPSFWGDFNCPHPLWDSRGTSDHRGEEVFDWVISFDLLPLNDHDILTLLHRSTGSRSSPDISFAPSSLALSCSWEVLQDLDSDHLPILLSILLSPALAPRASPFLQFSESSLGWLCLLLRLSMSFNRGILVSLSFLCCCSLYLSDFECGQIFHSFRPHQTPF